MRSIPVEQVDLSGLGLSVFRETNPDLLPVFQLFILRIRERGDGRPARARDEFVERSAALDG